MKNLILSHRVRILAKLFSTMVDNCNTDGEIWKNINLGKRAFSLMKNLPDILPGEFETPKEKAGLLEQMLELMDETETPRFCIQVREYIQSLDGDNKDNDLALAQLRDFVDLTMPMEVYCSKHVRFLKFDPVERTEKWENVIYRVEKQCSEMLKDEIRGMGFCFIYWSTKKTVLLQYGIQWRSPLEMNPGVIFD